MEMPKPNIFPLMGYDIYHDNIIGYGSFGCVYFCKKGDKIFAAKKIIQNNKIEDFETTVKREIDFHKNLDHTNIVLLCDACKIEDSQDFYIFTEYCKQGTLRSKMTATFSKESKKPDDEIEFEENYIILVLRQMIKAFKYIHSKFSDPNGNRMMHRDIKPENIFLDDGEAKLADFGMAKYSDINQSKTSTYCYMSPEMHGQGACDDKTDVFSLGLVLLEMMTNEVPQWQVVAGINPPPGGKLSIPVNKYSLELNTLVARMICLKKEDRISFDELFEHPIIDSGHNLKDIGMDLIFKRILNSLDEYNFYVDGKISETNLKKSGIFGSPRKTKTNNETLSSLRSSYDDISKLDLIKDTPNEALRKSLSIQNTHFDIENFIKRDIYIAFFFYYIAHKVYNLYLCINKGVKSMLGIMMALLVKASYSLRDLGNLENYLEANMEKNLLNKINISNYLKDMLSEKMKKNIKELISDNTNYWSNLYGEIRKLDDEKFSSVKKDINLMQAMNKTELNEKLNTLFQKFLGKHDNFSKYKKMKYYKLLLQCIIYARFFIEKKSLIEDYFSGEEVIDQTDPVQSFLIKHNNADEDKLLELIK